MPKPRPICCHGSESWDELVRQVGRLAPKRHGDDQSWKERTTGEGLIAFGALERSAPDGRVIFSDVSRALHDQCRDIAEELGVNERCSFVEASADDLGAIESESIDVVTTRSVLIYLRDKAAALREFFRVLRPGGRFACFEPINSFGSPWPDHIFWGYDVGPVQELGQKVLALYKENAEEGGENTLIDFDERDLFSWTERAGFAEVHLHYEAVVSPESPLAGITWDAF